LPRFSHHDDFSALFSSDEGEVKDYTAGLLFVACLIMSFFTVWGLLLLLFKCLGPDKVGILSGYPYEQEGLASKFGRGTFLFSAVMVMIFSILAVTKGLTKLQDTTDTIDATNQDVVKIHYEFETLMASLSTVSRQATPIRDELVDFLNGDICPLIPGFSSNTDIRQFGQEALSALNVLSGFISDELQDVTKALKQVGIATHNVDEAVQHVAFTSGAAVGIMIPYFIVPALLIVTLIMGWTETYIEEYFCFTQWFTLPMFILMVIFSYMACGFVVLAAESNSDFCAGGTESTPEATIANILSRYDLTEGEIYYDAIKFYSNQCMVEGPWGFFEKFYGDLLQAESTLSEMANLITQVSPESISVACGVTYTSTLQLISQLTAHTTILIEASQRSLDLLSCSNVVPLYTSAVYESTCQNNMTAASWLFACALVVSFFGMLMITLRGSYYPFYIWEGKDEYSTEDSDEDFELEEEMSEEDYDDGEEYVDGSEMESELYLEENATEDDDGPEEIVEGEEESFDVNPTTQAEEKYKSSSRRRK
jgi:hypothetical protein